MTAADFTIPEGRLAEALGVPRKTVKTVRADALTQGDDWEYINGGTVHYSRGGVTRTLSHLGIPPEKIASLLPAAPEPPPAAPADLAANEPPPLDLTEPKAFDITITRRFTVNHRLVEGTLDGRTVRVRVKDSQKLRPGMALRCHRVDVDLYQLAERLPRWPGKR